jgi:pimeloyl-ACP methyl ester carboxylesterase
MIALDRPDLARRLILVGTGPRGGGDGMDGLPADVAALFTKREELGEDMWVPIMFSPSKQSRAAGRAFIDRITARTEHRDLSVSDVTIASHGAAARDWGAPAADSFDYPPPDQAARARGQRKRRHRDTHA